MRFDWTFNVENLIMIGGALIAVFSLFIKMHERLLKVELWIEKEGKTAERALAVMETMSNAMERVSTLYEQQEKRMDRIQQHCDSNHATKER